MRVSFDLFDVLTPGLLLIVLACVVALPVWQRWETRRAEEEARRYSEEGAAL